VWRVRAHEASRMCSRVKHTFTSEGDYKRLNPMIPKCTPILGVALLQESRIFKALVEKTKKHQIGPPKYHWKSLKVKMSKVPSP